MFTHWVFGKRVHLCHQIPIEIQKLHSLRKYPQVHFQSASIPTSSRAASALSLFYFFFFSATDWIYIYLTWNLIFRLICFHSSSIFHSWHLTVEPVSCGWTPVFLVFALMVKAATDLLVHNSVDMFSYLLRKCLSLGFLNHGIPVCFIRSRQHFQVSGCTFYISTSNIQEF